jgi:prepilin-type N-terminal cleavage/methylation domain-containing protein
MGLPSTLVERRPDVRVAEAPLHAASAQIGGALSSRLPQLTLTATAGASRPGSHRYLPMGTPSGRWPATSPRRSSTAEPCPASATANAAVTLMLSALALTSPRRWENRKATCRPGQDFAIPRFHSLTFFDSVSTKSRKSRRLGALGIAIAISVRPINARRTINNVSRLVLNGNSGEQRGDPNLKLSLRRWLNDRGYSFAEMLVAVAVIGIVTAVSVPFFINYSRAAATKGGAEELTTILNRGRQLAIAKNTTVCVKQNAGKVQFLTGGCAGTVWKGPGTDANGWFTLQNGVNVTTNPQVVFNFIGAATTAGVYTVQNPVDSSTLTVTVALSGRITIP